MEREEEIEMWKRVFPQVPSEEIERIVVGMTPIKRKRRNENWQGYRFVRIRNREGYLDYLKSIEWHWIKARVWARTESQGL